MSFWNSLKKIGKKVWGGIKKVGKIAVPIIRGIKKGKDYLGKHMGFISKIPVVGKYAKTAFDTLGKPIDIADAGITAAQRAGRKDYLGAGRALYDAL